MTPKRTALAVAALAAFGAGDALAVFAELGVVILLFQIGLETTVAELAKAGATLCATSAGITWRVFRDAKRLESPEARIVLGAAVIDDVLGLVILAVVTGFVQSGTVSARDVAIIVGEAFAFLVGAVVVGRAHRALDRYREHHHQHLLEPLGHFLVPVFFVYTGMQVKLEALADPKVLAVALGVTVAAIAGKVVAGLAAGPVNRWVVGWGMVPRGEVGLIFAAIGRQLGVVDERLSR